MMVTLKVPGMALNCATLRVRVDFTTCLDWITVLFWFQVNVMYAEALVGNQLLKVKPNVNLAEPVFLT